jgi:hypothetical protein
MPERLLNREAIEHGASCSAETRCWRISWERQQSPRRRRLAVELAGNPFAFSDARQTGEIVHERRDQPRRVVSRHIVVNRRRQQQHLVAQMSCDVSMPRSYQSGYRAGIPSGVFGRSEVFCVTRAGLPTLSSARVANDHDADGVVSSRCARCSASPSAAEDAVLSNIHHVGRPAVRSAAIAFA